MSSNNLDAEVVDIICRCASCGIAEVDDIKLQECDGCDLVKYCSDECQENHRLEHEAMCKERAARLRDEILFKQPESSHLGDCPICCLPIPIGDKKSTLQSCCSKRICNGCSYAIKARQLQENIQPTCIFCRCPVPVTVEEIRENEMKRIETNDPVALTDVGREIADEDNDRAFRYWTKAAELGDVEAHYQLSLSYFRGEGVEKDEKKEIYHLEEAAIRGHHNARYNLACYERRNGENERAMKHFIIAASLGDDGSIQALKKHYKFGRVSKDDFAAALRAHHAAVKAMKSPQREAADLYNRISKGLGNFVL